MISLLQELMRFVSLSFDFHASFSFARIFCKSSPSRSARSPLRAKTAMMKNLDASDVLLLVQRKSYQNIKIVLTVPAKSRQSDHIQNIL